MLMHLVVCFSEDVSSDESDVFDMNEVSERRDRIYTLVLSADEFLGVETFPPTNEYLSSRYREKVALFLAER